MYKTIEEVFEDYKSESLDRMQAIEVLQDQFGFSTYEAEARVESWDS